MALDSFIVSNDPQVLQVLRRVLPGIGMHTQVCTELQQAASVLSRRKFDAILVDCDGATNGRDLLKSVRAAGSNKASIAFAIVNSASAAQAFDFGANFVLEKPLTADRVERSLRAARGLILREQRRYFRYSLSTAVWVSAGDAPELQAAMINLSEGGLAMRLKGQLPAGSLRVRFTLPESQFPVEARAELAWSDRLGRCGLRFVYLAERARAAIEGLLTEQMKLHEKRERA